MSVIDMSPDAIKERIRKEVKWRVFPPEQLGGQQVRTNNMGVTVSHDLLGISISINCYSHSKLKNKELAWTLFNLALDEINF